MAASMSLKELEDDPRLFLYTSLTAGSSHIITATSRMETILKANRIPFQAIDTATDTKARQLWQRRAGQRKLPGLVKEGFVIGDLNEVEEWNEFGELKENIGHVPAHNAAAPAGGQVGVQIAATLNTKSSIGGTAPKPSSVNKAPQPTFDKTKAIALPGAAEIAERNKAKAEAAKIPSQLEAINPETLTSSPEDKKQHIDKAGDVGKSQSNQDHLSAPAPRIQSGTATPAQQEEEAAGVLPLTAPTEPTQKTGDSKAGEESAETGEKEKDEPRPAATEKKTTEEGLKVHFEKKKPAEDVKKDAEGEKTDTATKGVADLKLDDKDDKRNPQEEAAKDEDEAGNAVED